MNRLTAIRTFAQPGFTPAKRVRIQNNKWYFVRFQNVETDPRIDYVGLAEGEYTLLLPGAKARQARDAHLNHCNGIQEYKGPVWALYFTTYGSWQQDPLYVQEHNGAATPELVAKRTAHDKWIFDCERTLVEYKARYDAKPESWLLASIEGCDRVIREKRDAFQYRIERIR